MVVYKLTDEDGYCRRGLPGETLYKVGATYLAAGKGNLCTAQWLHAYEHPLLAVLHDPAHGKYGDTARMWVCDTKGGVIKKEGQMKLGTSVLKIVKEIQKPKVTIEQRVAYAISCSLSVYVEESYVEWAEGWLSGKDRSKESAVAAAEAATDEWAGAELKVGEKAAGAWSARCAARSAGQLTDIVPAWSKSSSAMAAAEAVTVISLDLLDCAREVLLIE